MDLTCTNSNCRSPNPSHARFCCMCGRLLSSEGPAERRQLTVAFCDLVGWTRMSEHWDPEELMGVVRAYQQVCTDEVDRHEGRVAQYLGDGVMIYFGDPTAHDDDAQRAVRTVLAILAGVKNLSHGLQQEGRPELSVRIGIHTGEAVVGEVGGETRRERLAVGEVPNLASRAQGLADLNTIVMSEATYRLVKPYFTYKDLGAHRLKGLERLVQLYQVTGETEVQTRMQAAATVGIVPLVGRGKEAEFLRECWQRSRAGTGQVVLVRGEPGIGKSRLVEVLKGQLAGESYSLLECYCLAYEQHTAFAPLSHLLRRTLGFKREDSPQEKLSKLRTAMDGLGLDPKVTVPLLAPLVSITADAGYTPLALPPVRARQLTLEILTTWLLRATETSPVLLIVEDLHWMDPSSLELCSLVMGKQESSRMLMLLTYRPEFQAQWPSRGSLHELALTGLTEEESAALATHVAHNRTLPAEVLHEVVKRTDGVPLFIEELTKTILESGLLKPVNGSYELSGPLPPRAIPDSVQGSLRARLDRLGGAKKLAQIGATIGRDFRHDLFQAVAKIGGVEIERDMGRLIDANLVIQNGVLPQATYSFKHALIQEEAYRSLPISDRPEWHQRIASVLTERFPEIAESSPELLAQHFTAAGFDRQASGSWQKAGQRSLERAANREAITHLGKALERLQNLQDTRERRETELGLQLSLMPAHMAIRGWASSEVEACCVRARELCIELNDHQRLVGALWGLWTVHFLRAELDEALDFAEQVLNMALGAGVKMLEVIGHHAVGFTKYFRGELVEAKEHATNGIRLFDMDTEGQIVQTFQISSTMALRFFYSAILWFLGKPEESWKEREKASSLIRDLNHKPSQAAFMSFELCFYLYSRDPKRMKQAVEGLMKLSKDEGFLLYVPVGMMYVGWALAEEGNTEEGLQQIERGKKIYCDFGNRIKYVEILVMYAEVLWKTGRTDDALRALEEGMNHANTSQERLFEPELYRIRGDILFGQGNEPDAVEALDQAIEKARKQGAAMLELRAVTSKCRLWQSKGNKEEARGQLRQVYDSFTEGFDTKDLMEAKNLLQELGLT
jgi:class 3 adenylate cyclase/tetratricopeptide (TPR) repeat protein